jgi:hypothetical protein
MWFRTAAFQSTADGTPKRIPDLTPVKFPGCTPQIDDSIPPSFRGNTALVALLQAIHRPIDIQLSHFESLGLHVIHDATSQDILPDASYLPPFEDWKVIHTERLEEATKESKNPLSNGNLSPGVQTYLERSKELSIDNTAAFRTIRRIPAPVGKQNVRLGNAYEFFKNLEIFSGYWHDTSLPEPLSPGSIEEENGDSISTPNHLLTHQRTGTGSQLPADSRQHLITAFIKLVAYDFGCNVAFSRCEPRLYLTPPASSLPSEPPSYFNSSATFVYRTPSDRASARASIVEGPVAAVSCRATTVFATEPEERLDLARELVAVLLTAQQRAREGKTEKRAGEGKWWTSKPRWGGGGGGPIGREGDKVDGSLLDIGLGSEGGEKLASGTAAAVMNEAKRAIGGIGGPFASKRIKKGAMFKEGNLQIYENYRRMLPPSSSWDRKARYSAIGKAKGADYDDVFLVSALNHHVSIIRARVPASLMEVLEGGDHSKGWEGVTMWRSKWFDLFLTNERIEAMELVWGMMAWLMRSQETTIAEQEGEGDKMELN